MLMWVVILMQTEYVFNFQEECESKLEEAMPAMNAAISALNTLKQNDITIVKTMTNPPIGVRMVMEAVCILKVRGGGGVQGFS